MYLKEEMDNYKYNYPFHMPGHKRNYSFFKGPIEEYDITEFHPFDNLQKPEGAIKNTLDRIARVFKSHRSFISVNGSSLGIMASIIYSVKQGDTILVDRNCHKSVYSGIYLSRAKAEFVYPELNDYGFAYKYDLTKLEEKIIKIEPRAMVITSPTYDGYTMDIPNISILCKKYNVLLIVDEAHGSHFTFSKDFPQSSIGYGDFVINSLHKTMAGLNQTSLIHIGKNINGDNYQNIVNMLQTTSPSYIFLYSIDKLMEDLENDRIDFNKYILTLKKFRNGLDKLKNLNLIDSTDISRITLFSYKIRGKDMADFFRQRGYEGEMTGLYSITFISTVFDDLNIFPKFEKDILDLDKSLDGKIDISHFQKMDFLELKMSRDFDFINCRSKFINYKDAFDKVSINNIVPYPPGIPLMVSGEIINKEAIEYLSKLIEEKHTILGLNEKFEIEVED